ncbi:nudix hydrolase 12, mitochondrial-like [Ananas comosus]|uniref:Nudix hydrolase 12, mitochondrial-like n=1 Tax=Ananas comosus TaxID=4615 RepID=A0A6P5GTA3_ANACO|nr:nudix hydrolase 12, mitochondrial-like [Ananas comosus]
MSPTLLARKGRHRQRYDNNYRLVAGCIPYRLKEEGESPCCNLVEKLEVLMISTPNRSDLVFPKGGWEDDETVHEAACREALEEAGVRGNINENPLGEWIFRSKSRQNSCSSDGACKGYIFALEVTEELEYWPEQANHGRQWVPAAEAYDLCRYDWMRQALDSFKELLSRKDQLPTSNPPEFLELLSKRELQSSAAEIPEPSSLYMLMPSATAEHAIALC